jgi:hypothetical protein
VARALTVLRERHLEAELEAELARADAAILERERQAQASGEVKGTPLGEMERDVLDGTDTQEEEQ